MKRYEIEFGILKEIMYTFVPTQRKFNYWTAGISYFFNVGSGREPDDF